MQYYETFKEKADTEFKPLYDEAAKAAKQLQKIRKRRDDEKDRAKSLAERITKLKKTANESLTDDSKAYDKFWTNLKKLTVALEASENMVKVLESEVLEKAINDERDVRGNLQVKLRDFALSSKKAVEESINVDKKIDALLTTYTAERQSFLDDFHRIFEDFGCEFPVDGENYCPGIWDSNDIDDIQEHLESYNAERTDIPYQISGKGTKDEHVVAPKQSPATKQSTPTMIKMPVDKRPTIATNKEPSAALVSSGKYKPNA